MNIRIIVLTVWVAVGCTTINPDSRKEAPEIVADMPVAEAVDASVEFGGATLNKSKELFDQRKDWPKVNEITAARLPRAIDSYNNAMLINLMHLYQASTSKASVEVFESLVEHDRTMARVLGWNLAANLPSKEIRDAMDRQFSSRLAEGEEEVLYTPAMAHAVQANRMQSAYTLVREGLFKTGDEAFASAMITLDPRQASDDFLDYLSTASVEELRQLNQKEVNVYTCMLALRHLSSTPASINHPHFDHLFLYAVSRNQALADLAHLVLERAVSRHTQFLAIRLSRMPDWIQIAYVESSSRRMSPSVQTFMAALKEATPHQHVVEEIQSIR